MLPKILTLGFAVIIAVFALSACNSDPTPTPVIYQLTPNISAPAGVWKSITDRHPSVYMLVATEGKVPDSEDAISTVLGFIFNCDEDDASYRLFVEPGQVAKGSPSRYWEITARLFGDEPHRTTWLQLDDAGDWQPELYRLDGLLWEWPPAWPSARSEWPFWNSLLPGLHEGKDLHLYVDGQFEATFDAEGFEAEWDALDPSCASLTAFHKEVGPTQGEYRAWVIEVADQFFAFEEIWQTCGVASLEADLQSEAVVSAEERFAEAERKISAVATRLVPDGYDARYDTLPDDVWDELAPLAPEFMAAGSALADAMTEAYRAAGCDL